MCGWWWGCGWWWFLILSCARYWTKSFTFIISLNPYYIPVRYLLLLSASWTRKQRHREVHGLSAGLTFDHRTKSPECNILPDLLESLLFRLWFSFPHDWSWVSTAFEICPGHAHLQHWNIMYHICCPLLFLAKKSPYRAIVSNPHVSTVA